MLMYIVRKTESRNERLGFKLGSIVPASEASTMDHKFLKSFSMGCLWCNVLCREVILQALCITTMSFQDKQKSMLSLLPSSLQTVQSICQHREVLGRLLDDTE